MERPRESGRLDLNDALELLVERGRVMANHCAQTLNRLFRWGAKKGHVDALPLFDTLPGDREEPRDRVLADWEIREIWKGTFTELVFGPYGSSWRPVYGERTPPR